MTIDAINQPINIGDYVAYRPPYTNTLEIGTIHKVTPKGATISSLNYGKTTISRSSGMFVKITDQFHKFKKEYPEAFL